MLETRIEPYRADSRPARWIRTLEPLDPDELEDALEEPEIAEELLDKELERDARIMPTKRGSIEEEDGERF